MKLYDISQEIFSCQVYPGDPEPKSERILRISDGAACNLSAFYMCAHNGTHVDAPNHFYQNGKTIENIDLSFFAGEAYVASCSGKVTAKYAHIILSQARGISEEAAKRILIKGKATLTLEAADIFVKEGILLYGNESQTVGEEESSIEIHKKMLGADVVLLEGIRLNSVLDGRYMLQAVPLNLAGFDGAPCRAILMEYDMGQS